MPHVLHLLALPLTTLLCPFLALRTDAADRDGALTGYNDKILSAPARKVKDTPEVARRSKNAPPARQGVAGHALLDRFLAFIEKGRLESGFKEPVMPNWLGRSLLPDIDGSHWAPCGAVICEQTGLEG